MVTEEDGGERRAITHGIILVTRYSTVRVAGLSVIQRTIFAFERAGIHSIALVAPCAADRSIAMPMTRSERTRIRWCAPEALPDDVDGDTLLVLRPVILNAAAIESLGELGDVANSVLALDTIDRSGTSIATGAFLIARAAVAEVPRRVAEAIRGSTWNPAADAEARVRFPGGVCMPLGPPDGPIDIRVAEKVLLGSLRKKTDGFLAYWFDRRISTTISRYLVRTRVTPNQISVFTFFLTLISAMLIATPDALTSGAGALLFWTTTILDGCDGEVARLKYLESKQGARLDLLCDNIGLVALFLGIIVHVYANIPHLELLYAGAAIIGGMVAAMVIEYRCITGPRIRRGRDRLLTPGEIRRHDLYERLASRDFAYLLPVLAFSGTLSWFVWTVAVGVNLFWIGLVTIVARKRTTNALSGVTTELS